MEITNQISALIIDYLDKHPKQSLLSLSKKAGVGYSTIRRIKNKECVISLDVALNILHKVATKDVILDFVKKHCPTMYDTFQNFWTHNSSQFVTSGSEDIIFSDKVSNAIYFMSLKGVSVKTIRFEFGKAGIETAENLTREGWLKKENKMYYCADGDQISLLKIEDFINSAISDIKVIRREDIGTDHLWLNKETGFVSPDALKQIKEALKSNRMKIREIIEANPGLYPVFNLAVMNVYSNEVNDEN